MRLHGASHLGYCTNAHAAETAGEVLDTLRRVAAGVRERLDVPALGLGLYLAKEIMDTHGGTIAVHSVEGEGTTFTVGLDAGND